MPTPHRLGLALLASLLAGSLLVGTAAAQETHGTVSTVSGSTLRVELEDSLSVASGTGGRVVEMRTVGGNAVQMSFAVVSVTRVETPFDGPWVAVCQITRQSEDLEVGDRVLFEDVFSRARVAIRSAPPDATVYLDSVNVGRTPLAGPVGAGEHTLRLERDGFLPARRAFTVQRGEARTLRDTLQTARGTLAVNTLPDSATVQLEDRTLGTTPVSTEVQAGTYALRIQREGYRTIERTVSVPTGGEQRLNLDLQRPLAVRLAEQQADPVVNAGLAREGDRLVLEYDLVGDAEAYEVELQLSTNDGQTFEPLPETVAGAVGDEVAPGRDLQIVWSALEDFPEGFAGSGNRLRLAVEPAGGGGLYWVLGSALAAGAGGTAAAVLGLFGGGGNGGGGGGNGGDGLPSSPPTPP
ncbi:MAG: PEGA domain-containing protein, partial [Salinivenus sp.]